MYDYILLNKESLLFNFWRLHVHCRCTCTLTLSLRWQCSVICRGGVVVLRGFDFFFSLTCWSF